MNLAAGTGLPGAWQFFGGGVLAPCLEESTGPSIMSAKDDALEKIRQEKCCIRRYLWRACNSPPKNRH
jgi:hypothetical protein